MQRNLLYPYLSANEPAMKSNIINGIVNNASVIPTVASLKPCSVTNNGTYV